MKEIAKLAYSHESHVRECVICDAKHGRLIELERDNEARHYITFSCHCTAPLAIALDTIEHGLKAGWKCGHCGQTLMLSDLARASEALAADPCLPAVGRDFTWFKRHGCDAVLDAYARAGITTQEQDRATQNSKEASQ